MKVITEYKTCYIQGISVIRKMYISSYQELYQSCVSVLRQQTSIYTQSGDEEDERDPDQKATLNDSTRKLPSWMIGMETPPVRKNTPAKTSLCREETSSSTEGQTRLAKLSVL